MKYSIGDWVVVKSPPSEWHFGVTPEDWRIAVGNKYKIIAIYAGADGYKLSGAPHYASRESAEAIYNTLFWWWPQDCLELTNRHPVEVF